MLSERLQNRIDSIAEPIEIDSVFSHADADPETRYAEASAPVVSGAREADGPAPGSLKRRTLVAAAALAMILGVGGLLLAGVGRQGRSTMLASNGTDTALPTLPRGIADADWRKIDEPFVPLDPNNAIGVNSVTVVDDTAWAVGFEWRSTIYNDRVDARTRGAIWWSADGETWTAVESSFGSLELPGGNWVPSGIAFDQLVATNDGTLFVFGNEYRDTVNPVGYRSVDGETWESIEVPAIASESSNLVSASASGNMVLVTIVDDMLSPTEQTRVVTTIDGESWDTIETRSTTPETGLIALASNGDVVMVSNDVLPNKGPGHRQIDGGAAGTYVWGDDGSTEVYEGAIETAPVGLWSSIDGQNWTSVDRTRRPNARETIQDLFVHDAGAVASIQWVGTTAVGVTLFDIDPAAGAAKLLGDVPPESVTSIFVLNGELFIVGSEKSAALNENEEESSIWASTIANDRPPSTNAVEGEQQTEAPPTNEIALADFEGCVGLLGVNTETVPEVLQDGDGRIIIQQDVGTFDGRISVCEHTINERLDLSLAGSPHSGPTPISPEQSQALQGGVTEAEYEQAWDRLRSCLEAAGIEITRTSSTAYTYSAPDAILYRHDACYAWHFGRVDSIWQVAVDEQERTAALERLATAADEARSAISERAEQRGLTTLLDEVEAEACTAGRDGEWITTFDSMPQPLCIAVGEEAEMQFWNKGYQRAIVDWGGEARELVSDSHFETGRLGDTFDAGANAVSVDPYGIVRLLVVPEELSLMASLNVSTLALGQPELVGTPVGALREALGVDLIELYSPATGCVLAQVANDPYSPTFLILGDSVNDGIFAGTGGSDSRC